MINRQNQILNIDWSKIDTVLLDMDGTLLDLHYDDYFWLEYMPVEYARVNNIPLEDARAQLNQVDCMTSVCQGIANEYPCAQGRSESLDCRS